MTVVVLKNRGCLCQIFMIWILMFKSNLPSASLLLALALLSALVLQDEET